MAVTRNTTAQADSNETASSTADVVLAPLVSVKDDAGRIQYLYRGAPLPKSTPRAELDRLREMELIGPDDGSAVPGVAAPQE